MRNMSFTYRIFVLLLVGLYLPVFSFAQLNYPSEQVVLLTDRFVYISGESIQFSGNLSISQNESTLSEVVYVELILPNGQKISQAKLKPKLNKFEGELSVSPDVLSGYYFLRAYSKWMRNGDVSDYAYVRLKVINPFTDELMFVNDSLIDSSAELINKIDDSATLSLDKVSYNPGEQILMPFDSTRLGLSKTSLSIIPAISSASNNQLSNGRTVAYTELKFYPETKGITLSGKVIRVSDQTKVPYHKVNIHLENEKDFIAVLSDSVGDFNIALPHRYGRIELFAIAASLENEEVEILIDQDFCSRKIDLKVPEFTVNDSEKEALLKMVNTYQLKRLYQNTDSLNENLQTYQAFYGDPYKSVDFDSYVALDSLSQYFTDLPSWVKVKVEKGKRKIVLYGPQASLQLYEPLIMIDWIPVDDVEHILALDPRRINNFEVIITPYIHGGITYGGILNIFSRKNDFAGMNFPESAEYINYDFYNFPRNKIQDTDQYNSFDNTILWIADLSTVANQNTISTEAPLLKGEYVVLLQSIDENGNIAIEEKSFSVE